jgi:predicted extracellular nuclease
MDKKRMLERGIAGLLVVALVLSMVPLAAMPALAAPTELFFSEYIEGSSYNKALEIYNGTGAAIDLGAGGYAIEIYFNGATTPVVTIALTGTVADGDVFVVADDEADAAILAETDQTSTSYFFNGDDAVVLLKGSDIIDVIGQIGVDPGDYWGSGDVTTQNHTLRRKGTIEAGDIDGSDAFDPTIEWDGYAEDTFDGLGSHSIGGPDYTPIYDIQYTTDPSGDSPLAGQVVTTEGLVTAAFSNGYFVEDAAGGAWNGLWVYDGNTPNLGDHLRLTGTVDEYYNLTELTDLTGYEVLSSGSALPDPVVVTTGAANDEQYESVLIRVENVEVTAEEDSYGEWEVDDSSGPLAVDNLGSDTYVPVVGEELAAIIGPLNFSYGAFKIAPRDDNDIVFPLAHTPIYDIQYTTDPSGDSPYVDQEVMTEGLVTAVFYNGYFVEDAAGGAWNGLWVYDGNTPNLGDHLRLTGTVDEYYNLTELTDLTGYEVLSSGNALPDPVVVTTGAANDEQYESVLIRVENVEVTAEEDSYGEWEVDDSSGPLAVDNLGSDTYVPVVGEELVAIIGPLNFSYGAFKIAPRDDNDIVFSLDYTPIYDIQYTADPSGDSPLAGQEVTTDGVVTAAFYGGYFIEDQAGGPWNGLYVYDTNEPDVGDRLRLTGMVAEYYNLTELTDLTGYEVLSSGNALPDPAVLPTGDVSQEQWEGVLVRVENVTVTDDDLGYGEWSVSDGSGDLVIDDKGAYTYEPTTGDALVAVIGPLDFGYGAFKIQPRDDNDILEPQLVPELIINEIIQNPAAVYDSNGEWFELYNPTGSDIDIDGWTIEDNDYDSHVIANGGPLIVPAGGYLVLGINADTSTNGGVSVGYEYSGISLANGADELVLVDGALNEIDRVEYDDGATFPDPTGASMSLVDPALDNNVGGNWCTSTTPFGDGDLGTPGSENTCEVQEACGDAYTPIYNVQGSGDESPLDGNLVSIEGVVTGDFQTSDGLRGFYVQDPLGDSDAATSDGIFVYDGSSPAVDVNVGDAVRVRGTVDEYYYVTEITNVQLVLVCGTGSVSATPVDLPVDDDLEPYEGMLVTFPEELTASQNYFQGRYGQVTMSSEGRMFQPTNIYRPLTPEAIQLAEDNLRRMFILDDGTTSQNEYPIPYIGADNTLRAGDTVVGLTGVIDYGPINSSSPPARYYRLQPTEPPVESIEFTRVNERTAEPDDVGGLIKIASFNVLNYFNGDGMGGGFPTSRGADSLDEFIRQRDKIISAILAMDADVIGLMEIENDGYDEYSAIADLVNGLNDAAGAGTYAFIDPGVGPVGTDEIAVGFIYRPGTVTPAGAAAILDSSVDPDFNSDYNRPAIAQTFDRSTGGGRFTAVVNHLKSKGSPCDDIGDPDIGDGQGNCNLTREAAAIALTEWLATDPTGSGDTDVFIIGDLNSYAMEDPIIAIEGAGYANLVKEFFGPWAYSYIFDGQAGYLDHALSTPDAAWQVSGTTIWHINTDEPSVIDYNVEYKSQDLYTPTPYRSSDHDPVIVGFCEGVPPDVDFWVTRDTLWPPNHRYVTVHAHVDADDNLDLDPVITLVSVTSNQPDNGLGDGDKPNDILIINDYTFKLRAERAGGAEDRIYTITYEVTDSCGNVTVETEEVTVPHDWRKPR